MFQWILARSIGVSVVQGVSVVSWKFKGIAGAFQRTSRALHCISGSSGWFQGRSRDVSWASESFRSVLADFRWYGWAFKGISSGFKDVPWVSKRNARVFGEFRGVIWSFMIILGCSVGFRGWLIDPNQ